LMVKKYGMKKHVRFGRIKYFLGYHDQPFDSE
jgi:hypothetical protein